MNSTDPYQALLIVSFGGPEGPDDVMPFLENVLRGRNVPRERMLEVAEHYQHFGGVSPINEQCRELISALKTELNRHEIDLPVYWGNRNWAPFLADTIQKMKDDGIERALAFFTSGYSCYSGCRQYRENIVDARQQVGDGAPEIHKLRMFYNHPRFISACSDRVRQAIEQIPASRRQQMQLVFSAHSIPLAMAENSDYVKQLTETSRLIAQEVGEVNWKLVFQSRSGPPAQPWLEPDVCDHLESVAAMGITDVVLFPVGFLSDHMEVLFDLDTEAVEKASELDLNLVRAKTVGVHPEFIAMIRELVIERAQKLERPAIGNFPANHDVCPKNCCLSGRPGAVSQAP